MNYFVDRFNPREYDGVTDLSGNEKVTLMVHNVTGRKIVRKKISGINIELYKQLTQAEHDNLIRILGLEETQTGCYTYEEYVDGKTLAEILINRPVTETEAVQWIGQLCGAVRVLHEQHPIIIHRDIKPSNVLLSSDGVIKLIDFDAAKEFSPEKSKDTVLIGTPEYAAPEQYGFATSDPRTDIYAIGILFHELLTGSKPNGSKTAYKGRYRSVIRCCVELDPEKRYRSVRELNHQLGLHRTARFIGNIPGFRTGVWWKKIIASIAYIIAAVVAFSTVYDVKPFHLLICLVTLFVPPYILGTNFLRVRERLPLLKARSVPVKAAGAVLYLLIWIGLFSIVVVSYSIGRDELIGLLSK